MLNYASRYERIDIGLSGVCNLSCNMCRRPQEREFMSPQRVHRLLSEARTIGVKTISFSGGEPFVHPRFRILLETALGHGFAVELVTNGTLVRASDILNLERLKCITVSVDGPKEVHDLMRGKRGTWERFTRRRQPGSNGVVYLSDRERKLSAISPGRRTLPLLERGIPREA